MKDLPMNMGSTDPQGLSDTLGTDNARIKYSCPKRLSGTFTENSTLQSSILNGDKEDMVYRHDLEGSITRTILVFCTCNLWATLKQEKGRCKLPQNKVNPNTAKTLA